MIPINGVLIGIGKTTLEANNSVEGTTIPAGTTHFTFGFTDPNNRTKTHGHVSIGGVDCILQSGVLYCLHTHSYKPIIKQNAETADTFQEVTFYRIDTKP